MGIIRTRMAGLRWRGLLVPPSIRGKVALGAAAVSLVVVALVTMLLLESMRSGFSRVLTAQQDSLVDHLATELDGKLALYLDVMRRAAAILPPDALDSPGRVRALYENDPALLALFDDILVLDVSGQVRADVPELPGRTSVNAADRDFFARVLRTGEAVISDPVRSRFRQEPIINMAAPVRAPDGRIVAVVTGVLRLNKPNVLGSLATERIGTTGYVSLLTKEPDPVYIVHPDRRRILQRRSQFGTTPSTTAALQGTQATVEDRNSQGIRALFSYRTLHTPNWLLVAVLPSDEAFAPIEATGRIVVVSAAALGLLTAIIVWILMDRLLAPLTRLSDHIRRLRGADPPTQPAAVEREDETGALAVAFNELMDERLRATQALEARARELRLASKVFESTADAVIVSDADDRVIMVNPAFTRLTGYAARDMVGHTLADSPFRPLDPLQSAQRMAHQRAQGYVTAEVVRHRKDGTELPLWVTGSNVTDDEGRITHYVRVFTDISHLKASQRRLETLAISDALTGVRNRRAFDERLQAALERWRSGSGGFAILFADLDAFKAVNDAYGHERGDDVLRTVARRLQACVRADDTLCRLGGDEFAVILAGDEAGADAARVAVRMIASFAEPFALGTEHVRLAISIGIALCPDQGTDPDTLLHAADMAMYAAKRAGGGCFVVGESAAAVRA